MAELQQQLIWLGAGTARQPALNFNAFSQVTLVEAREDACIALQHAYSQPNISVLQQLISAEAESQSFISYNLAEFSAISPIAGLKDLFPGLKTKSQERLQSQAVKVLIDQINTNQPLQPEANTLIIDIPDQAHSLLSTLIQTKQLTLFNTLVIPYGAELYAGMADIAAITELLIKEHFVLQSTDNSDPDLPLYSFKLDAAAKKVAQLNHKVKQLTEQLAAAQQSEANNRQQLEQQKAELTKQLEAAKQQAATDKQQLEHQRAELSKQLDAAKQQAAADKQQLEQQKAELTKQLEAAKQRASADKQQLEQQKAELIKQLEAAKQHASTDKQQLEQQKAELSKQLETAKQQAATEKQQSEQQKAELGKQLEAAKQQVSTEKQQLEQQKAELSKQLEAAKQQASAEKQQLEQQKTELSKQLDVQNKLVEQVNNSNSELMNKLQANQEQLFSLVEQKVKQLINDQSAQLISEVQNAKNSLTWVVGNSAKQVESFIGIQNYLERGIKPLNFHGWPISPDIGLYIAGLIDSNNYDLIIEFGSGTSTVLMAKVLQVKQRSTEKKNIIDKQAKVESLSTIEFDSYNDLPARIITFEHNSKYHTQTLQTLINNGVDHLVNLIHAPLIDYRYKDGSDYLYYNCNETLQGIEKILKGRKANILVLVDGPPGSTNKNARFPCLPHILKALPNHAFTIVMDDYARTEEKETTELWRKMLEERSYAVSIETIANEKGVAILRINY